MARKLSFLLRRRPELTREQFQRTWLEDHAPKVRERADFLGCRRYVQVHTDLDARVLPDRPEPYDGVAELWFDPALARGTTEERARAMRELVADEARFVDLAASPLWMGEERPVLERGGVARRLTYALRRRPELSRAAFQRTWWEDHGPLVSANAWPRLRRYVQVHTNEDAETFPARAERGAPEPFDGIALLWYDDAFPANAPDEQRRITDALTADEQRFIDLERSPLWMGREVVILER